MSAADESVTGICKPLARASEGADCAADGGEFFAGTTHFAQDPTLALAYCDYRDHLYCEGRQTCALLLSEGDDCSQGGRCPVDHHCNATCQRDLSEGDDCTQGGQCDRAFTCLDGRCRPRPFDQNGTCSGDYN